MVSALSCLQITWECTAGQLDLGVGHVFIKTGYKFVLCHPPQYHPASKPAGLPLGTLLVSEPCHEEQQMRTCPKLQYFLSHLWALWTS